MEDIIQISIQFQRDTAIGTYSDCLYFAFTDWFDSNGVRLIPDEYIEELIDARVQSWVDFVTAQNTAENGGE